MAEKISETVQCKWESRTVNDGKRQHLTVLTKTTTRGVFQRQHSLRLLVQRHLELPGKPYTVDLSAPGLGAFHFYKQPYLGHKKPWSWVRNYLITHVDFFLTGPTHRSNLAQRQPVA